MFYCIIVVTKARRIIERRTLFCTYGDAQESFLKRVQAHGMSLYDVVAQDKRQFATKGDVTVSMNWLEPICDLSLHEA